MKVISLNTYGGRFFEPVMSFIKEHSLDTDIFCFQEMLHTSQGQKEEKNFRLNFFEEISLALSDFKGFFVPGKNNYTPGGDTDLAVACGLAIFVRNSLEIKSNGDFFTVDMEKIDSADKDSLKYHPFHLKAQYIQIENGAETLTVCNVHGLSWPFDKLDTPERIIQSERIINFLKKESGQKIVVGDFNLFPNTKSIKIFEENYYRNLIGDFRIKTTRGTLVKQMHPEYGTSPAGFQEFADYTFVTDGIAVKSFEVPDLPLSDHLPMILKFD